MRAALLLAAASLACAHAAAPVAAAPAWPPPPAAPRLRWAGAFPPEGAPAGESPWWRRAARAVLGIDGGVGPRDLFERPFGLSLDGDTLLVADPDAAQVLAVDWKQGSSTAVSCPARAWIAPMAVTVAPDRTRYVADAAGVLAGLPIRGGCFVFGEGRLQRPTGVAFAGGRVWAVDPPRHGLVAFTPDGHEVLRVGERGEGEGQLHFPTAIAADAGGGVVVVDALNFRISRFAADGRPLAAFGEAGETEATFSRPKAVALDGAGRLYVSDAQSDQVKVFAPDGRFELAAGATGTGAGRLQQPAGLAVGAGRLFVADSLNRRIAIFELVGEPG